MHDRENTRLYGQFGWLFANQASELDPDRALDAARVALCFLREERFDSLEMPDLEALDVLACLGAAIGIDRVDLDPQAVVPVSASRLRQPGADRDEE